MKSGLNYWHSPREALEIVQKRCHEDHMDDIGNTNDAYKSGTKAFARVWQAQGETDFVMRTFAFLQKRSLRDKINEWSKSLKVVKSKKSWMNDGEV